MTLSTDDLRHALADAADAPYDTAGVARMRGVRARVRRDRRRRVAAAGGVGLLGVAALVVGVALGGAGTATPAPASSPARRPTTLGDVAAPTDLPRTWGMRDVVAPLTGSGSQTPAQLVTWPQHVTGVVVRCDGVDHGVEVSLEPASGAPSSVTFGCTGASQPFQVGELSPAAARIHPGEQVRVQVRLDRAGDATPVAFGAGLLVGRDVIDMSTLRATPKGFGFVGSYAMADGAQYSGSGPDPATAAKGTPITDGVQIALAGRRAAHLLVRCSGAVRLDVDPGSAGETTSVTCPAGVRSTTSLDVALRPTTQQRLTLRAVDAEPGALVEVGVSTR